MKVELAKSISVTVSRAGWLSLSEQPGGAQSLWSPAHTAAWIALQQHGGDAPAAATTLAGHWGAEPSLVRKEMDAWVSQWVGAGYLRKRE
ncbi:hypothetical protein [Streptomyces sp. NPDC047315]|uniref:hypothetical protein n=1 Tax=Streptomyces sp. NPDC047315 TaxID=3155142 RepID=UPI00340717FE